MPSNNGKIVEQYSTEPAKNSLGEIFISFANNFAEKIRWRPKILRIKKDLREAVQNQNSGYINSSCANSSSDEITNSKSKFAKKSDL